MRTILAAIVVARAVPAARLWSHDPPSTRKLTSAFLCFQKNLLRASSFFFVPSCSLFSVPTAVSTKPLTTLGERALGVQQILVIRRQVLLPHGDGFHQQRLG